MPKSNGHELVPRVVISVPMERNVTEDSFWAFMQLAQQGYPFIRSHYGLAITQMNLAGRHFLEMPKEFTHLLYLDLDHNHPPQIAKHLAARALEDPERKIIGALVFRRGPPYDPCVFVKDEAGYHALAEWDSGIFEVDVVGNAALLVAREVLEKVPQPWFRIPHSPPEIIAQVGHDCISWDFYFCEKCKAAGYKIWFDATIESPHQTQGYVNSSVYRAYAKDHPTKTESALTEVCDGRN